MSKTTIETKETKNAAVVENKKTTPVVKAEATKTVKTEAKKTEKRAVENAEKKNEFISIEDVTKMYAELGIKCKNPNAKGLYRIMGSGSSLNVKPKKGYYIYTSDADMELVQSAGLKNEDLVIEGRTNAQDKQRPNTIICTALETLKVLLAVYAKNPANVLATEETKPAVAAK